MSNKLVKKNRNEITITIQQYMEMKEEIKRQVKQDIFEELQKKATSMQAQALMLSFGLALFKKYHLRQEEILEILECTDQNMADFWTSDDLEKFREYVQNTCGFDIRIPGYADEDNAFQKNS